MVVVASLISHRYDPIAVQLQYVLMSPFPNRLCYRCYHFDESGRCWGWLLFDRSRLATRRVTKLDECVRLRIVLN